MSRSKIRMRSVVVEVRCVRCRKRLAELHPRRKFFRPVMIRGSSAVVSCGCGRKVTMERDHLASVTPSSHTVGDQALKAIWL